MNVVGDIELYQSAASSCTVYVIYIDKTKFSDEGS